VTSESGGQRDLHGGAQFAAGLGTDVTIPVQSSNTAEGTVSVSNLKFTTDNGAPRKP